MIKSNLNPKGELTLRIIEAGMDVRVIKVKNLVVIQGRTNLLKLFGGDSEGRAITKVGVGTGSAAPDLADTSITSGFVKTIGAITYPTSTSITFSFNIASGEANGKNIKEFALFNSSDLLCARTIRSAGIEKTSSISIDGTWTIKLL